MAISSHRWPGRLRYVPMLNIGILIASVVTFGLAVSYARESIRTPMWEQALIYMRPRPANSKIIIYAAFMPFFSILHSLLDLTLHFLITLDPVYSLAVGSIYFIGWLVQWSLWMHCEISGIGFDNAGKGETCFQVNLDHPKGSMIPMRSSKGVVDGRVGVGFIVVVLYAVYAVAAGLAVARNRRTGGRTMDLK